MKLFWQKVAEINELETVSQLSAKTIAFLYRWLVEEGGHSIFEGLEMFSASLGMTKEAGRKAVNELVVAGLVVKEKRQFSAPQIYRLDFSFVGDEFDNDESKIPFQIAHCLVSHRASYPSYMSKLESWIEKSKIGITKRVLLSALLSLPTTNGFVLGYSQARLSLITGIPQRSVKLYLKEFSKTGLIAQYPGLPRVAGFGQTRSVIVPRLESMIQGDLVTVYLPNRTVEKLYWSFSTGSALKPPLFHSALGSSTLWELYLKIMFESPHDVRGRSKRHSMYFDLLARKVASTLICVKNLPEASDALGLIDEIVGLLPSITELEDKDRWPSRNDELYAQAREELDCHDLSDEDLLRRTVGAMVVLTGLELARLIREFSKKDSQISELMFDLVNESDYWIRVLTPTRELRIYFYRLALPQ
ncbi:MAG: hypothetical protein CMH97_12650 [Oceanospirillaceae bacterium]|mgnify:CR=1 FL=1|nr:hypothetical protein [Oceanospirillaceae bacterium]|tara:strand:- start:464 stop:1714 length:1251 start_codon:yes stop_codon:yes gene_type:complete